MRGKNNFRIYYDLVREFINYVDARDIELLKEKFGLTDEIIEELYEGLACYYNKIPGISILPFDKALAEVNNEQKNFDFFKFNEAECWGVDCKILADGKLDEPIFHFRICMKNDKYILQYLYIGS